jgi:hypothetical protein
MKEFNYENKQDAFGRRTAAFYKNFNRQEMGIEYKPTFALRLDSHGVK